MKQGRTLIELAAEVERQATMKRDFVADTRQVKVVTEEPLVTPEGEKIPQDSKIIVSGNGEFPLTEHAHSQLRTRLKIPAPYYERLRKNHPDLLDTNINELLHTEPERRMIRTLDGKARAYLSNRYRRIDNFDLMSGAVLPTLQEMKGDFDQKASVMEVTESRMYLKLVYPKLTSEIKRGDIVQAGVLIANSEIGMGSVKVQPILFRLVCLNGMIREEEGINKYHIGRGLEEMETAYELTTDETRKAQDRAFFLTVRDVVKGVLSEETFSGIVLRAREAAERHITGNPEKAVEILANRYQLSENEQGGVLRTLIDKGDLSAWGLSNAVTQTAQTVDSFDRSTELETLGGRIIELPPSEWKTLAAAA